MSTTDAKTHIQDKLRELNFGIDVANLDFSGNQGRLNVPGKTGTGFCYTYLPKSGILLYTNHHEACGGIIFSGDSVHPDELKQYKAEKSIYEKEKRDYQDAAARSLREIISGGALYSRTPKGTTYIQLKKIHDVEGDVRYNESIAAIPMYDRHGAIINLQEIYPDSKKKFRPKCRVSGSRYTFTGHNNGAICLCEGFATGYAIYNATKYDVVCAFSASNITTVAKELREEFPRRKIVVVADNDIESQGNVGRAKAEKAAKSAKAYFCIPDAINGRNTDAWDVWNVDGAEVLKELIENAFTDIEQQDESLVYDWIKDFDFLDASLQNTINNTDMGGQEYIIQDKIALGTSGIFASIAGLSKSSFCNWLSMTIATQRPLLGSAWKPCNTKKRRVISFFGEDNIKEINRRMYQATAGLNDVQRKDILEYYRTVPCIGKPFQIMQLNIKTKMPEKTPFYYNLMDNLKKHDDLGLLIFDGSSLSHFSNLEADPLHAHMFGNILTQLATELNCAVLMVHHATKNSNKAGADKRKELYESLHINTLKGSANLVGGVRFCIIGAQVYGKAASEMFDNTSNTYVALRIAKSNIGPTYKPEQADYFMASMGCSCFESVTPKCEGKEQELSADEVFKRTALEKGIARYIVELHEGGYNTNQTDVTSTINSKIGGFGRGEVLRLIRTAKTLNYLEEYKDEEIVGNKTRLRAGSEYFVVQEIGNLEDVYLKTRGL